MCGIVGVINKNPRRGFNHREAELFRTLLLLDTLRGKDSTGIFGVDADGNVDIAKDTLTGSEFTKKKEYTDVERKMIRDGFALIGHNRAATRGNVVEKNAHPFWYKDEVVLVHNGTFTEDHKKHADVEVDSEALCHLIGQHSVDDVDTVFNKINAAYATVWYDVRDKSLNIVRNDQRPLHFYDLGNAFVISSEKSIMLFALARCDFKYKHEDVVLIKEDTHVKFKMEGYQVKVSNKDIEQVTKSYGTHGGWPWPNNEVKTEITVPALVSNKLPDVAKEVVEAANEAGKVIDSFRLGTDRSNHNLLIDEDLGPQQAYSPFNIYEQAREYYPTDGSLLFAPRGVVTIKDDQCLLYGFVKDEPEVIGAVVLSEKALEKLVDNSGPNNYIKIRIRTQAFLNKTTSLDVRENKGLVIIYGVEPENIGVSADACC